MTAPPPMSKPPTASKYALNKGRVQSAQRVMIYGPPGAGKSTLASYFPRVAFCDLENGTTKMDVARFDGIRSHADLMGLLRDKSTWPLYDTLVIDSTTQLHDNLVAHILATIANDKGVKPTNIEGYDWGKGWAHVYAEYCLLLSTLDQLHIANKNVVIVAHSTVADTANPDGEDYIIHSPNIISKKNCAVRERVQSWCDHVIFVSLAGAISKNKNGDDGKITRNGVRMTYHSETGGCIAKSRTSTGQTIQPQIFTHETAPSIIQSLFN